MMTSSAEGAPHGPIIGPVVAILSFVCSIGNVPLAAVLWNGGISFGGVASFMYADLLIIPILNIYRKYYGVKMMLFVLATFYSAMVLAGYVVELVFGALGLVPAARAATVVEASITWNYTSGLNIVCLALAAVLLWRFFSTGGMDMLRMMGAAPPEPQGEGAGGHAHAMRTIPKLGSQTSLFGSSVGGSRQQPVGGRDESAISGECPSGRALGRRTMQDAFPTS